MPTATRERRRLTAEDARYFSRYSVANAAQALHQLNDSGACQGSCQPYEDIFTYNRWQALGYQVRKGEHGAKLAIIIANEQEDEEGRVKRVSRPWATTVFCRCQVDKRGASVVSTSAN